MVEASMMIVRIEVNDEEIETVEIINRGPARGADPADRGSERLYEWHSVTGQHGTVIHARRDGAPKLVAKVMALIR
jgi:hypothetical protein